MSSYLCFARHLARAAVIERTRQRTYLHSTEMRSRPYYSTYRSEPVRESRYAPPAHEMPPRLFVVDPPDYEMASNFARRRYDHNVRLSVNLETRQPRRPKPTHVSIETRQPRRTHKNVRFEDAGFEYETRSPAQGSPGAPWSRNTREYDIRYQTRVPTVVHSGLHGVSSSGRRVLRYDGGGACPWF